MHSNLKPGSAAGKPVPKPFAVLTLPLLVACSAEANHLGNPLTWPAAAVTTALSNASYDARRAKVTAFVNAHHRAIISQASAKGGPAYLQALSLAQVPENRRASLKAELTNNPIYADNAEALVVALMVHGA